MAQSDVPVKIKQEEKVVEETTTQSEEASRASDGAEDGGINKLESTKLNVNANEFVPRIKHNHNGQAELNLSELQRHFELMDKHRKNEVPIVKTAEVLEQALIKQTLENNTNCQPAWKNFPKRQNNSPEADKSVQKLGKGTRVVMLDEGDYFITPRLKRLKRERSNTRCEEPWDPELKSMYGKRFESEEKRREHERKVALEALKLVEQRRARAFEKESIGSGADSEGGINAAKVVPHISHSPLNMTPEERDRVERLRKAKKERIERILREMQADELHKVTRNIKEQSKSAAVTNTEVESNVKPKKFVNAEKEAKINDKENDKPKLNTSKKPKDALAKVEKNEATTHEPRSYVRSNKFEYVSPHDAANKYANYPTKQAEPDVYRKPLAPYLGKHYVRSGDNKENYQQLPQYQSQGGDYLNYKKYGEFANAKPLGQNTYRVRDFGESVDYLRYPRYNQYGYGLSLSSKGSYYSREGRAESYQTRNPYRMYESKQFTRPLSPAPSMRVKPPSAPPVPNNTPSRFYQQQQQKASNANLGAAATSGAFSSFCKPEDKQKMIFNYARQLVNTANPQRRSPHDAADPRPLTFNATAGAKTEPKRTYDMKKMMEIKNDVVQTYAQVAGGQPGAFGSSVFADFEGSQNIFNNRANFGESASNSTNGDATASAPTPKCLSSGASEPTLDRNNDAAFPMLSSRLPKSTAGDHAKQRYTIADLMNLVPPDSQPSKLNISTNVRKMGIMRN